MKQIFCTLFPILTSCLLQPFIRLFNFVDYLISLLIWCDIYVRPTFVFYFVSRRTNFHFKIYVACGR